MSREQKEDDMGEMMQGVTNSTASPTEQQHQQQQQKQQQQQASTQKPVSLPLLDIEVIKLQLVPYLDNNDRGALFDSCRYLRPLKQTEFIYKFNRSVSFKYATDTAFRELVHQSAAINQRRSGKRMIHIDLSENQEITDVSMLGEVVNLHLYDCRGVTDVTALGEAQMLNVGGCRNIANYNSFIRRLVTALSATDSTTASIGTSTRKIAHTRECAAFTLKSLVSLNGDNWQLIVAEGSIPALVAVLTDESRRSSSGARKYAAEALGRLCKSDSESIRRLVVDAGSIPAMLALVSASSDRSSERELETVASMMVCIAVHDHTDLIFVTTALIAIINDNSNRSGSATAKQYAAYALKTVSSIDHCKQVIAAAGGITALIALLSIESDLSTAAAKTEASKALVRLAADDENIQQLIVNEGGITAVLVVLTDDSYRTSVEAREQAARTLREFAAECESMRQLIAEAGSISALIAAARAHSNHSGDNKFAQYALQELAKDADLKAQIHRAGGGEFLPLQSDGDDDDVATSMTNL